MPTPPSQPAGALHCPNCGAAASPDAAACQYCQAPLATMACPSCFARLFIGADFCPHCGARAARAAAETAATRRCPGCRHALQDVQVGPLTLSECDKCSGVWVDASTFEALCKDLEAQAAVLHTSATGHGATSGQASTPQPETRIRYRPCPQCKRFMNRVNFAKSSGVVLDVCREHGTFFDRDELHRVVTFIRGGGLERARDRERLALAEEERRLRSLRDGPRALVITDDAPVSAGSTVLQVFLDWLTQGR